MSYPIRAFFSRRAVFVCPDCHAETLSELGGSVLMKDFVMGAVGMAVIVLAVIFFWEKWLLLTLTIVGFFIFDARITMHLHRRNLLGMLSADKRSLGLRGRPPKA